MKKTAIAIVILGLILAACKQKTPEPTATPVPPTATPIPEPTQEPTDQPTEEPTEAPTAEPTAEPTEETTAESSSGGTAITAVPPTAVPVPTIEPPSAGFITFRDFEIVPLLSSFSVGQQVVFLIESASNSFHQPYTPGFLNPGPNDFEAPANLGNGTSFTFTFREAGPVTILCGFHANMIAQIVVLP